MIELENLDNRSINDILDEAKKQVKYLSTGWTNFQESDPGITLIELFAWLKSVQHEYLNRIPDSVKMKFLKLLNVTMYSNCGSKTLLEVSDISENVTLPIRTPWKCGNMIFENLNHQTLITSNILSVLFQNPECPSEEEYYKLDGNKVFYLFGTDIDRKNDEEIPRSFTINFDTSIPANEIINIYFDIYVASGLKRNPIGSKDKFVNMSEVKWEYYGIEKGQKGWHDIEIVGDKTYNFLFSGIIKIRIRGDMIPINEEYKIRCSLVYDEYDYPPRVTKIIPNVFQVCQNDTKCENIIIKKGDIRANHTFKILNNLAVYGHNEVYYKKHLGWVKTNLVSFESDEKNGALIVNVDNLWNTVKHFKHDDEVFMVVSCTEDMKDKLCLGSGTSISEQTVKFNSTDVLTSDFEIMISEKIKGEEVFYKWSHVSDLFSSGKYDRHYIISDVDDELIFGDHEHGMAPRKGVNNIRICSLRYTLGERSNVKSRFGCSVNLENEILKESRVTQISNAIGGCDAEKLEHAEARAANLFSKPGRAVTVKDYEEIVRRTPGLMFLNIKVLPEYMPGEDITKQNCVTIAVRWNHKIGLTLPRSFEQNIMNRINRYRLLNTKVKIIGPEYIGLTISGEIVVKSSYRDNDKSIENEIKNYIDNINSQMGQILHFGDFFGTIDKIDCVSYVDQLRIVPSGNNVKKNTAEDIIVPPNGIYYIQKIDFNYLKNSEFYRE